VKPEWRRTLRAEVLLVLGVSLGASAMYAAVSLAAKLTAGRPLRQQTATLNPSQAPGRPWLDLTYQLLGIFFALVPAVLAIHLLARPPEPTSTEPTTDPTTGTTGASAAAVAAAPQRQQPGTVRALLGIDLRRPGFDLAAGAILAAAIGIPGLGLYLVAKAVGINATVVAAALPPQWWAIPILVLSAVENAVLEEVVVVGYLLTRLRQLGWSTVAAVTASALLRGSYHLYQGFGAFLGNAVMGVVFGLFFLRTRRVLPLVVAHAVLDVVSFVGYALLAHRLSFLR
jgi:membrane protease YdiL (CAAX protease family)